MITLITALLFWLGVLERPLYSVTLFDVGQGDSLFVEWHDGTQMLVDGGPSTDVLSRLGEVMLPWDRSIDFLVLTHPHADHVRGLYAVTERFQVGTIVATQVPYFTDWYEGFLQDSSARKIPIVAPWDAAWPEGAALLYPISPSDMVASDNVNESSIVLQIGDNQRALLMGDAGVLVEQRLLSQDRLRSIDVLKVGHQGSRGSTSAAFLRAVQPGIALIPVGDDNRYGHPHDEVLNRLRDFGARVLRTDQSGTIRVRVFGDRVDIKTTY